MQQNKVKQQQQQTQEGVNSPSKYVTQVQQQRPESPTVTLTWYACKYKVHKLRQRFKKEKKKEKEKKTKQKTSPFSFFSFRKEF